MERKLATLKLDAITHRYSCDMETIRGLSHTLADGQFLVVLGPSGCGKTTLLRLIAGLETLHSGQIWIGGQEATHWPPERRDLAMVFQQDALYPHLSGRDNLRFALQARRTEPREISRRIEEISAALHLTGLLDRRPAEMSGGQRQRIALARALVRRPNALLFDEPLAHLDAATRRSLTCWLAGWHRRTGTTAVYVTHDQAEAMVLADELAVMDRGRFAQVGPPLKLFAEPATTTVARMLGSPEMNLIAGRHEKGQFRVDGRVLPMPCPSTAVTLGIRPEDLALSPSMDSLPQTDSLRASVPLGKCRLQRLDRVGHESWAHLAWHQHTLVARTRADFEWDPSQTLMLSATANKLHWFNDEGNRVA